MRQFFYAGLLGAAVGLSACGDKKDIAEPAPVAKDKPVLAVPDVGGMESVAVTADGYGATASEAVSEAMKLAILQVNGAAIQTSAIYAKYGLDVTLGQDSASLRAADFAEAVRQRSGGVIQNFKVVKLQEPSMLGSKRFKATILAEIAKFSPSADMQKIKVVIGPIRFDSVSLPMGDRSVQADEVGAALRQRIGDALVQTGRFAVLDRDFSPQIATELDMISSGQAPSAELAKLSQAASADIVWSARVNNLAYDRHARQLKTSERELVSYSGGWAVSHKLVNVATRQVMASGSLRGSAPSTEPTTLNPGVDSAKVLEDMSTDMADKVVASILRQTFPVSVVSRDGVNVILSQGGQALKEQVRYAVVALGRELKDPQTGQSIGRIESPCCDLVVERVTSNLSYGRLENVRPDLDDLPIGALLLRGEVKGDARPAAVANGAPVASIASAAPKAAGGRLQQDRQESPEAPVEKQDDKW